MTARELRERYKELKSHVEYVKSLVKEAKRAVNRANLDLQATEETLRKAQYDLRVCEDHFFLIGILNLQVQHEEELERMAAEKRA